MSVFSADYWQISPVDNALAPQIRQVIDGKIKPIGSLGALEALALQLACIQSAEKQQTRQPKVVITSPTVLLFAADHGVATHGVSIAPQQVTGFMTERFLEGSAAINCFCRANDVALRVIDAGLLHPISSDADIFFEQRIAAGTADFSVQAAMTTTQVTAAMAAGEAIAKQTISEGSNTLAFGEMGIGNTTSASTLLATLLGLNASEVAGLGTGISPEQLCKKTALIDKSLRRVQAGKGRPLLDAESALIEFGGFEITQIVGAMLATAQMRKTIIVDGFIVGIAAMLASYIHPNVKDYMVFSHHSAEGAFPYLAKALGATPLLDLGLRLGEGTGAVLAVPLLRSAASFYNDMAVLDPSVLT